MLDSYFGRYFLLFKPITGSLDRIDEVEDPQSVWWPEMPKLACKLVLVPNSERQFRPET